MNSEQMRSLIHKNTVQ